ncbi:MAG: 23S rRNA (guanosine(2251)-2'-O)-methyltransferase RlmB [Firmicutes bacterium]|nr:23S rRNA (guanosine(2251)-2'-O)-methyltransferase RlmB [Bacillota bacterium]
MGQDKLIWGRNIVLDAIRANRTISKILIGVQGGRKIDEIRALAQRRRIPVENVERRQLDNLTSGLVHQGVVAFTVPRRYVHVDDILARAAARKEPPLILALAQVEDPRNLGAAARTAAAAGAHGLVIPLRRAAPITGAAEKAAAGALDHIPVARVTNLRRCLTDLKAAGLWVMGADMDGDSLYYETDLTDPVALVVGGEDKGLGRLIARECDFLVRIPMRPEITSLNTSVAASLLLYEAVRQRDQK